MCTEKADFFFAIGEGQDHQWEWKEISKGLAGKLIPFWKLETLGYNILKRENLYA